jgi:hypothetical protein
LIAGDFGFLTLIQSRDGPASHQAPIVGHATAKKKSATAQAIGWVSLAGR